MVGEIAGVLLGLPSLRVNNLGDSFVRFVDAPSFVCYAHRYGVNAIENDV
jgi:hypothetical protein